MACMAKMPPECGVSTAGVLCCCTRRWVLVAASLGLYLSSSATSSSLYFLPATSKPPASFTSLTAISMPLSTFLPYCAAPPLSGPV